MDEQTSPEAEGGSIADTESIKSTRKQGDETNAGNDHSDVESR